MTTGVRTDQASYRTSLQRSFIPLFNVNVRVHPRINPSVNRIVVTIRSDAPTHHPSPLRENTRRKMSNGTKSRKIFNGKIVYKPLYIYFQTQHKAFQGLLFEPQRHKGRCYLLMSSNFSYNFMISRHVFKSPLPLWCCVKFPTA